MDNQFTMAVAGSGKTQQLAEHCASLARDKNVLVVTFTQANQVELQHRIRAMAGDRPRIRVVGWYTFLLRDFARPFFPFRFPGEKIHGFNFEGRPSRFSEGIYRFLDSKGAVYSCELGRIASELIKASGGALQRRIECCYDEILIDEVQDLAAHDWDILDFLFGARMSVRLVGDFRQAVLSTNPRSSKHKKYAYVAALEWFREREGKGILEIQEHSTTWRCRPEIAAFSDAIYESDGDFPETVSKNNTETGHDGVFWIHPDHADTYVSKFEPQCLRDSVKSGTAFGFDFMNFGAAKGTEYQRVLIVPTRPIEQFVSAGKTLSPKSAAKFYVAVTRASQSVAIVLKSAGASAIPPWRPDDA